MRVSEVISAVSLATKLLDFFQQREQVEKSLAVEDAFEYVAPSNEISASSQLLVKRALELIRTDFQPITWQAFEALVMHDQKTADVAESLGISVASAYQAKSRVLSRLRTELEGAL